MRRISAVVLAVLMASCATQTTPASTTSSSTSTTTLAPADAAAAVALFEQCMVTAGHGVNEIPLDPDGRPDLGVLATSNADSDFRQALTECAPLLGALLSAGESPGYTALVRDQLVRYAQCMRASGVEDFPDPAPEFAPSTPPFPPEAIPTADPQFAAAIEACASALASAS